MAIMASHLGNLNALPLSMSTTNIKASWTPKPSNVPLCYSSTQKEYKCYNPSSRKFYVSVYITFAENTSFFFFLSPIFKRGSQQQKTVLMSPLNHLNPWYSSCSSSCYKPSSLSSSHLSHPIQPLDPSLLLAHPMSLTLLQYSLGCI